VPGAQVTCDLRIEPDTEVILADAGQLEQHCYRTGVAESADDAWDALQEACGIDLVVLDVVLPAERYAPLLENTFTVDRLRRAVRDVLCSSANRSGAATAPAAPKVASRADHVAVGPTNAEV
jgi:hypothetical protein